MLVQPLEQVAEQYVPEVAVDDRSRRALGPGVQQLREECGSVQSERIERLPCRQSAGMRGQLQDSRIAEVGTLLQPGDLRQRVAERRVRIDAPGRNGFEEQWNGAQHLGQRRQVVPRLGRDGWSVGLRPTEARRALVATVADRRRGARNGTAVTDSQQAAPIGAAVHAVARQHGHDPGDFLRLRRIDTYDPRVRIRAAQNFAVTHPRHAHVRQILRLPSHLGFIIEPAKGFPDIC